MSPANVEYLLQHNPEINKKKVEVCPNCLSIPINIPTFKRDSSELKRNMKFQMMPSFLFMEEILENHKVSVF